MEHWIDKYGLAVAMLLALSTALGIAVRSAWRFLAPHIEALLEEQRDMFRSVKETNDKNSDLLAYDIELHGKTRCDIHDIKGDIEAIREGLACGENREKSADSGPDPARAG